MQSRLVPATVLLTLALSSCGAAPTTESPQAGAGESSSVSLVSPVLDQAHLANLSYTLINTSVRLALTKASRGFSIDLRDGTYLFPGSVAVSGFTRVHADFSHLVYGDINHDGTYDAVLPLFIDQGDSSILELAAVTESGSAPKHFASFPIGTAALRSLAITDGKIRVNFTQMIPGDPGPRNTELQLELPRK